MASGATCVQRLDGSQDSAIHTKYRISQRSSSMREPRYPLPRVVFVYRRSTGPPDARRGRGARGRLSIQVFLGAFRTGVRWSPAGARPSGTGGGARAECRSTPPTQTPQLLNTFPGSFCCAGFHNNPFAANRGFDNDPSAGSPTETLLRLLLPLNDKVQWTSRDVAGSEPPTSPRSEHFTGSFNRQIAPPTKNGHAPPPIESRKSSQSVNPYYVWTWGADGFKVSAIVICKERRMGQIGADDGPMPAASAASKNLDRRSWTTTSHDEARESWDVREAFRFAPRMKCEERRAID
ncbi:hypothetical protein CQW23_32638 [Capsicum baccatum]|uniref:Uncharacterized protein n=1 Tax=Capsicum baccatum TaxID=33114 RepID=A0A2G2V469_CAPBA|nr:hypothetical protein CQW23_32638 [Capsicum baccatum]